MKKFFTNGLINENPTFRLLLGMCPTMAVTTAALNGLGMGLSTMMVLIGSNTVISALRKFIPDAIRIPAFIVIIASFVTIVGMLLKAYVPVLDAALGIYIPLIVVNCIILGRAEAFAFDHAVLPSFLDGAGMGLGFTMSLTVLGAIREIFGAGSLFGISLFGPNYQPVTLMILPPGGFIVLGLGIGFINFLFVLADRRKQKRLEEAKTSSVEGEVQA